jgi:hypothetical protein
MTLKLNLPSISRVHQLVLNKSNTLKEQVHGFIDAKTEPRETSMYDFSIRQDILRHHDFRHHCSRFTLGPG